MHSQLFVVQDPNLVADRTKFSLQYGDRVLHCCFPEFGGAANHWSSLDHSNVITISASVITVSIYHLVAISPCFKNVSHVRWRNFAGSLVLPWFYQWRPVTNKVTSMSKMSLGWQPKSEQAHVNFTECLLATSCFWALLSSFELLFVSTRLYFLHAERKRLSDSNKTAETATS